MQPRVNDKQTESYRIQQIAILSPGESDGTTWKISVVDKFLFIEYYIKNISDGSDDKIDCDIYDHYPSAASAVSSFHGIKQAH